MSDTREFLDRFWEDEILPSLTEYVAVPNVSVLFDPDWEAHGHMEAALQMGKTFMAKHAPDDAVLHVGRIPGRTPLLLLDCPGEADGTILMYGHLDKQPEMVGWREGLGPWSPVREGDKLYGRGGADDGYALYCALAALKAVAREGKKRARVVLLVEFSEESGSPDLPAYMESLADVIGTPDLVICLDSGAGNYDQLWSTTSLRGMVGGTLKAEVLTEGVHSGDAGGVVPPPFLVLRKLLDRIEEPGTDRIVPDALHAEIPAERIAQAEAAAETLGADTFSRFPWAGNTGAPGVPTSELILNRTWRPNLAVTGQDGLPSLAKAGQRPPAPGYPEPLVPDSAHRGSGGSPGRDPGDRGTRSAVRRQGDAALPRTGAGLVGARARPLARRRARRGLDGRLWETRHAHGGGRLHPVHGDARRALPGGAVRHHRGPRPGLQRPRPERVPGDRLREAPHRGRCHRDRPPRHTGLMGEGPSADRPHGARQGARQEGARQEGDRQGGPPVSGRHRPRNAGETRTAG